MLLKKYGMPFKMENMQWTGSLTEIAVRLNEQPLQMKRLAKRLVSQYHLTYNRFIVPYVDARLLDAEDDDARHFAAELIVNIEGFDSEPKRDLLCDEKLNPLDSVCPFFLKEDIEKLEMLLAERKEQAVIGRFVCRMSEAVWGLPHYEIRQLSHKILSFSETAARIVKKENGVLIQAGGGTIVFAGTYGGALSLMKKVEICFHDVLKDTVIMFNIEKGVTEIEFGR